MGCSTVLCKNNIFLVRDISMTQPSLKQLQEDKSFTLLKPGFVLLFCEGECRGGPHCKEAWKTEEYRGTDGPWGVDPATWEAPMEQRCSHTQEIQTMIPGRDKQSVKSTKMEMANQK
jgi:hypothetical protein